MDTRILFGRQWWIKLFASKSNWLTSLKLQREFDLKHFDRRFKYRYFQLISNKKSFQKDKHLNFDRAIYQLIYLRWFAIAEAAERFLDLLLVDTTAMIDDAAYSVRGKSNKSEDFFLRRGRRKFPNFALYPRKKPGAIGPFAPLAICNSKRKVRFPKVYADALAHWHMPAASQNLAAITLDRINRRILMRYELARGVNVAIIASTVWNRRELKGWRALESTFLSFILVSTLICNSKFRWKKDN